MPKKVLIVDDCTDLRQLVFIALDYADYQLSQAASADEVLKMLANNPPDLIVLDVMMPGKINGYQLCEYIKNHPQYHSIKVILLTARGQKSDVQAGISAKSDAYLIKPFSPDLLHKKVDQLLGIDNNAAKVNHPEKKPDAPKSSPSMELIFPPRPSSMVNVQQEMNKKNPEIRYIAQQIAADITLSAELLKTVNSPFYGLRNKVSSVADAVNLIGLTRTLHLVTAVSVRNSVPLPVGMELFWDDTSKIAIMETSIARHLALDVNLAYLLGLFHNAAVPLMAMKFPDYLSSSLELSHKDMETTDAEQAKYNMNHAMLGSLLARTWYLPAPLIEAIRLHHCRDLFALGLDFTILNLISVHLIADNIANQLKGNPDEHFSMIKDKVRGHLSLLDDVTYQGVVDVALDSINQA